jgi:hypothetical protein
VPAAGAVTFAAAPMPRAVGPDQVTALVGLVSSRPVAVAVATFVEEGAEAGTPMLLLAATVRWMPGPGIVSGSR